MDNFALFINIVPWRPHGDHAAFIATQMKQAGWVVEAATCGGGLNNCYQKMMNRRTFECIGCQSESLSSYGIFKRSDRLNFHSGSSSGLNNNRRSAAKVHWSVTSSVANALRVELDSDLATEEISKLISNISDEFLDQVETWTAYFERKKPDFVCVFNGRFHDTAAVVEACKILNVKYVTHERTWFGRGIQINKNADCIALPEILNLVDSYSSTPLSYAQAKASYELISSRFLATNKGEWRQYGQTKEYDNKNSVWPQKGDGRKILIVPSSRSEFMGHPDYLLDFRTTIDCLEYFLEQKKLIGENIVIRSHPAWLHKIGHCSKSRSYDIYKDWAEKNGIFIIHPQENISTYSLMEEADFSIFNGGSAVVEAAVLGCPSVLLSPSPYMHAGIALDCSTRKKINLINLKFPDHKKIFRQALRYVYSRSYRQPYFLDSAIATEAKEYTFYQSDKNHFDIDRFLDKPLNIAPDENNEYSASEENLVFQQHLCNEEILPVDYLVGEPLVLPRDGRLKRLVSAVIDNFNREGEL